MAVYITLLESRYSYINKDIEILTLVYDMPSHRKSGILVSSFAENPKVISDIW